MKLTRRALLASGAAVLCGCAQRPAREPQPEPEPLAELEKRLGGRVGVFALDTESGRQLAHRADERFAMCSTFKWALVAAVLVRVDRGELGLDRPVSFGEKDLLEYAPVTKENVARGEMTLEALAEAAVTLSDNTAANLLLATLGGPRGLTDFFRAIGDRVTRLDRDEPMLNTNFAGDPRDTTSPRAMVGAMRAVLTRDVLTAASRERLLGWMKACATGRERLRAGLPAGWLAGDKTGTGNNGASNDVAIVWPPGRAALLIASYLSDSGAAAGELNAAHAEIARIVVRL